MIALLGNLQAELQKPGSWHWGTQFDVKSLSDALDIGVHMFCDRMQDHGKTALYNIGSQKEDYSYWISLWWQEPVHFRLAELTWSDDNAAPLVNTHTSGELRTCPPHFWTPIEAAIAWRTAKWRNKHADVKFNITM